MFEVSLFALPTELISQIAERLSFEELCTFRRTCRAANALLVEGDVMRRWVAVSIDDVQLGLHSVPAPVTFRYALEQQHRLIAARALAGRYCDYVERDILPYTLRRRDPNLSDTRLREAFQPVWQRIKNEMLGSLLLIQDYFERIARTIMTLCAEEDLHNSPDLGSKLRDRERQLFDVYETSQLHRAHQCFLFMSWVNGQLLKRPSYVGTVEHAMRGWIVEPLRICDFHLLLVLGNLRALAQLMELRTFKDRRKAVEASLRRLNPASDIRWQQHWADISMTYNESPAREQATRALRLKSQEGDVWANTARKVLIERNIVDDADVEIGTPRHCMDYLTEIAGYDILHQVPEGSAP